MDVTFFENQSLFKTHLQGERKFEDSLDLEAIDIFSSQPKNIEIPIFLINTEINDFTKENLDSTSMELNHEIAENKNEEKGSTKELLVYLRRNRTQGKEIDETSQHCQ